MLQQFRREMNILFPYRIPPSNTNTRNQETSNHSEHDLKKTSKDLRMTSNVLKITSKYANEMDKPVLKKNKNNPTEMMTTIVMEEILLNRLFSQ